MDKEVSTTVASKILKCSRHHVITCLEDGRLMGRPVFLGERMVWKITVDSLESYRIEAAKNKRVSREMKIRYPIRRNIKSKGYNYVYKPTHLRANCDGYVPEQILVMEEAIGRPLTKQEVVHHVNRNKTDNHPENLVLYANNSAHIKAEHSEELRKMNIGNQYKKGKTMQDSQEVK